MQTATCYTTKEPKDNILYINKKATTKIPNKLNKSLPYGDNPTRSH